MEFYLITDSAEVRPTTSWEEVGTALARVTMGENKFVVLSKCESGNDYI